MTSRQRVQKAIRHQVTDRVPIDLGATSVSGIHVETYQKLRGALGLEVRPPVAQDPLLMIARVEPDVREALAVDVIGVPGPGNSLGLKNDNFKRFTLPDGFEVLVCGGFAYTTGPDGTVYAYPQGDLSCAPSARMAKSGLYFDPIPRQEESLDDKEVWDAKADYAGMYTVNSEETLRFIEARAKDLFDNTTLSLVGSCGKAGLGDAFHVPAPWLKETKGIREMGDWLMAMRLEPEYLRDLFAMQTETALQNLALYREAVGGRIDTIFLSGTDFAHQNGLMIAPDTYRDLFMPFYKRVNGWVHEHTDWKTMMHCCGAAVYLLPEFIESGFDILNPVQVSAKGMDAQTLKDKFGSQIVFWGGGCDPQHTMPVKTPEEVYEETKRNAQILSRGGGYIGGNVHNVQYDVPPQNLLAELRALRETVPQET